MVAGKAVSRLSSAFAHVSTPVDELIRAVNPQRNSGSDTLTDFVQVSFSSRKSGNSFQLDDVTGSYLADLEVANGQLPLEFILREDNTQIQLDYSTSLVDEEIAAELLDCYLEILRDGLKRPECPIRDLAMVDAGRVAQILQISRGPDMPMPSTTLVDLFEEMVPLRSSHVALVGDNCKLTYQELNERSNRLAHHLIQLGIGSEGVVGLHLAGSVEFIVGVLAILKTGAGYLPIDPEYPAARVAEMIASTNPLLILDAEGIAAAEYLAKDFSAKNPKDSDRCLPLYPTAQAYIIFTSGSTGTPKGVCVEHHAIADHLIGFRTRGVVTKEDRLVTTASVSFDASIFEIFGTLSVGATLVIAKPHAVQDISYMADLLIRENVTVMHMVPSTLATLLLIPEVKQWTSLRAIPVGGEALQGDVADTFTYTFSADLSNNYGPTEAVVAATSFFVEGQQSGRIVPIGKPNVNVSCYLLDTGLQLVPDGIIGEIYLGGTQLARGYLGRAGLTAERFIADPFAQESGRRLYRTGDLARRNSLGDIEFIGRVDEQVKIRGYRIELGEVRASLVTHPEISDAVVTVHEGLLAAYIVPLTKLTNGEIDRIELMGYLRDRLPEYMMPQSITVIDKLPLTVHGKLDAAALPMPELIAVEPQELRTETEKRVAEVFRELFQRDDIKAHHSFFDLGGHSLLAARLVTALTAEFGIDIDLRMPLDHPTVAGLAAAVSAAVYEEFGIELEDIPSDAEPLTLEMAPSELANLPQAAELSRVARPPVLLRIEGTDFIPLSFSQLAMWFQYRFVGPSAVGNIPISLQINGILDSKILETAIGDVIDRHESLRTIFKTVNGIPYQLVQEEVSVELSVIDSADLAQELVNLAGYIFDIENELLLQPTLIRVAPDRHVLALVFHHLVIDHASLHILLQNLVAAYQLRQKGQQPYAREEIRYADYAVWQHKMFPASGGLSHSFADILVTTEEARYGHQQLNYWRKALADLPEEVSVIADKQRPAVMSQEGVSVDFALDPTVRQGIRELAEFHGSTEFMVLAAAVSGLLTRFGAGNDIAIGTPAAARIGAATEKLVGLLANMVVLRISTANDPPLTELLIRAREATLDAHTYQDVPIERVVEAVAPKRLPSRNPLFQTMIHFRDDATATDYQLSGEAGTTLRVLPTEFNSSLLDINIIVCATADGGYSAKLVGSVDLFEISTISALAVGLTKLLTEFSGGGQTRLSAVKFPEAQGILMSEQHADDPALLSQLISSRSPYRIHAKPTTLAALAHTGNTTYPSVRNWICSDSGAGASLSETLQALAFGSILHNPFDFQEGSSGLVVQTLGGEPQSETEKILIQLLEELLNTNGIGRDDNFFAVGGDSIISVQLAARAEKFGLAVTPQMVFEQPTLGELALAVDQFVPEQIIEEFDIGENISGLSASDLAAVTMAWQQEQGPS